VRLFGLLAIFLSPLAGSPIPASGRPTPAPDALGPWAVGHTSFDIVDSSRNDRALPIEAWYPADPADAVGEPTEYMLIPPFISLTSPVAVEEIPVLGQPWLPLVVFSHGSGSLNIQSTELMEILASHGFVVVAPNHTGNTINDPAPDPLPSVAVNRPRDVSFLIDHMLERSDDPLDPFFLRISPVAIGVVGHSFGGYTALAMPAGASELIPPDPRVRAIVPTSAVTLIHSDEELASITIPTMLIGGTLDTTVPIDPDTVRAFELTSAPFLYRADIVGATHSHFSNVCSIADVLIESSFTPDRWPGSIAEPLLPFYEDACVPGAFPIEDCQRIQALYTVAFFRRHLYQDLRYAPYLREIYALTSEPDVVYFDRSPWQCGAGSQMALVLPPLIWLGRRRRRSAPELSGPVRRAG
jgi:predicted dienelactone hydrolase